MEREVKLRLIELIQTYCKRISTDFIFTSDADGLIYAAVYGKKMSKHMGYTKTKNARIINTATSEEKKMVAEIRNYLEEKKIFNRTNTGKYIIADSVLNYKEC